MITFRNIDIAAEIEQTQPRQTSKRLNTLLFAYLGVFVAAFLLYSISCAPTIVWQDSSMIVYRAWHGDIEGKLGLALSHPLFYLFAIAAKNIPMGEYAYRVNLLSAIFGAATVANIFLLLRIWLEKTWPAIIAAATLMLSHTFWQHSSIAETYTLYTALLTAELLMVLQFTKTDKIKFLYWLALLNGLAIANHMLASIAFVCYAVYIIILFAKKKISETNIAIMALAWIIGALPYEYLIVSNIIASGDVIGTLSSAAFGTSWKDDVLNVAMSAKIMKENFLFILLNFPTPNIILFFVGLLAVFKLSSKVLRNILIALLILFLLFAFRYTIPDRYTFFIPFYCIVSIFIGLGAHKLLESCNKKYLPYIILAFCLLPIAAYIIAPIAAQKVKLNIGTSRVLPYRNSYSYFLRPWLTNYRGAEKFADEALSIVEPNAIIRADNTTVYPLLYVQEVKNIRHDVSIISSLAISKDAVYLDENNISKLITARSIYVVSAVKGYCPEFILKNYDLEKKGVLWQVKPKRP